MKANVLHFALFNLFPGVAQIRPIPVHQRVLPIILAQPVQFNFFLTFWTPCSSHYLSSTVSIPFSHLVSFFFFPFCLAWTWLINLFSFIIFSSTIFIFKSTIFLPQRYLELDPTTPVLTKKLSLINYKLLLSMVSRINMSPSITSSNCDPDCESWKDVSLWIFLGQQDGW